MKFYNGAKTTFIEKNLNQNFIEIETFVNSINVSDGQGKEITLNIKDYEINNDNTFYTDSNGLETLKRINNYRPTWQL